MAWLEFVQSLAGAICLGLGVLVMVMNWLLVVGNWRVRWQGAGRQASLVPLVSLALVYMASSLLDGAGWRWYVWVPLVDPGNLEFAFGWAKAGRGTREK